MQNLQHTTPPAADAAAGAEEDAVTTALFPVAANGPAAAGANTMAAAGVRAARQESKGTGSASYYYRDSGGLSQRVRVIFEYVMDATDTDWVGIRIWFIVVDETINLGQGISWIIEENKNEARRAEKRFLKSAPEAPKSWETHKFLSSKDMWAFSSIDGYLGKATCFNQAATVDECPISNAQACHNPEVALAAHSHVFGQDGQWARCTFVGANSTQNELANYRFDDGREWSFPQDTNAFSIPLNFVCPKIWWMAQFPERLAHGAVVSLPPTPPTTMSSMLLLRDFVDADDHEDGLGDLHILALDQNKVFAQHMQNYEENRTTNSEHVELMKDYRTRAIQKFKKIWNADANISEVTKTMCAWFAQRQQQLEDSGQKATVYFPQRAFDTSLSSFANGVISKMHAFEESLFLSTCHSELFTVYISRLDAYRHNFGLHNNFLLTGQGATSKSFCFECLEAMSIPETILTITHQTAKADAIDDNQNDQISIYHEMPPALMGIDPKFGSTDTGDPLFKEKLTSQKFKTKTFLRDEATGKRMNVTRSSEQIGVIGGATNDPPSKIPEAMRTRFMIIMLAEKTRKGREVIDLMGAATSTTQQRVKAAFLDQCRVEQFLVATVEKMIWTRCIQDVNMNVAKTLFNDALATLYADGVLAARKPRHYTRLINFARTLTIVHAVNQVFNHTCDRDHAFALEDMLQVEGHLVCTEEIAYFTLTQLRSLYINPHSTAIIQSMAALANYTRVNQRSACYAEPDGPFSAKDYNYLWFPNVGLAKMSHLIAAHMSSVVLSHNNIMFVLEELRRSSAILPVQTTPVYQTDLTVHRDTPILKIVKDPNGGQNTIYISSAHVYKVLGVREADNQLSKAINHTFHAKSKAGPILMGEAVGRDVPQFLSRFDVKKNSGKWLSREDPSYDMSDINSKPCYVVDEDFHTIETTEHCGKAGLTPPDRAPHYAESSDLAYPEAYRTRHLKRLKEVATVQRHGVTAGTKYNMSKFGNKRRRLQYAASQQQQT